VARGPDFTALARKHGLDWEWFGKRTANPSLKTVYAAHDIFHIWPVDAKLGDADAEVGSKAGGGATTALDT
jgi:hypothetical protein